MTRRLLAVAFSVVFFFIASTIALGQEKGADESNKIGKTPAVFVDAVKGECRFDQQPFLPNGLAADLTARRIIGGQAVSLNQPKILTRLDTDYTVKISIEEEFRKTGKYRIASSPDQANLVFHVCSSYWENWAPKDIVKDSALPPTYRMAAHAFGLSSASYLRSVNSYIDLNSVALFGQEMVCCQTGDKKSTNKRFGNKNKRKNKKEIVTTIGSMGKRLVVPAGEATPQELARSFFKEAGKIKANLITPGTLDSGKGSARSRRPLLITEKVIIRTNPTGEPVPTTVPAAEEVESLKIDTALVALPVSVLDKDGKFVPKLTVSNFKVFEDGVEQQISDFGSTESPFHVALILDVSGSTSFKIEDIQQAASAFIAQLRNKDQVMIVSFDSIVRVDAEFTNERGKLLRAIQSLDNGVSSRVYDALDLVLTERLARVQGRKAIVFFSDGMDTASKLAELRNVVEHVQESDALLYSIRYDTWADIQDSVAFDNANGQDASTPKPPGSTKEDFDTAAKNMKTLTDLSGGRYYNVESIKDINKAFAYIADELRRQYWLEYYPSNTAIDGSYRRIRVTVNQPGLVIRTREGYRVAESPEMNPAANSQQETPRQEAMNKKP